jgi:hypothetical protein
MLRDIIERFSYRFEVWRRQEAPDYFGVQRAAPADLGPKLAKDPKRRVVLTEPTLTFIARGFVTYFGIVGIVAIICRIGIGSFPGARVGIIIGFIVFACVWGTAVAQVFWNLSRARQDYRSEATDHLTNQ